MRSSPAFLFLIFLALLAPARGAEPLLLLSLDGFRWDYLDRFPAETPNLRRLRAEGASARGLIPPFPSNTFPGHYTLVTGLTPSRHGMLNNNMFDAATGTAFRSNQPLFNQDARWWGGEPIWNTATRQGRVSACYFWPGSEAPVGGLRPALYKNFNASLDFETRLEEMAGWLDLPEGQRPAVITFYIEEANSVGHRYGPDSPEIQAIVKQVDAQVAALRERLERGGRRLNLVIVSDHGMTPVDLEHVLVLENYLDVAAVQIDFEGSVVGLRPFDGNVERLIAALAALPPERARAYAAADLPGHLKIDPGHPRVPPVWILPAEGWRVYRQSTVDRAPQLPPVRGDHGYDPRLESMQGILIAHGPAFRGDGTVVDAVESIHVYNLLCAALGLQPAPNDGDARLADSLLAR
jgi:predicted AlkP superfamily pyrophosphatase or phosphodiesterase